MKVILLKNIEGLGHVGDAKEVKPGYWRNFLVPQKMAVLATPALLKEAEARKKLALEKREIEAKETDKVLSQLEGKTISVKAKADEKGTLFAGIGAEKIVKLIKKELKLVVPENILNMEKPVKETGLHKIEAKNISFNLDVTAE